MRTRLIWLLVAGLQGEQSGAPTSVLTNAAYYYHFGIMVVLTGCSSEVEKDLVRCKASAVETNR